MAVKFLSEEWAAELERALNENDAIKEFAGWAFVTLEFVATDAPDGGEIRHWRKFADGEATVGLGPIEDPTATLTMTYDDSVAVNKGELDLQAAFTGGKLKVDGDITALLQYQSELAEVAAVAHGIDAEF